MFLRHKRHFLQMGKGNKDALLAPWPTGAERNASWSVGKVTLPIAQPTSISWKSGKRYLVKNHPTTSAAPWSQGLLSAVTASLSSLSALEMSDRISGTWRDYIPAKSPPEISMCHLKTKPGREPMAHLVMAPKSGLSSEIASGALFLFF